MKRVTTLWLFVLLSAGVSGHLWWSGWVLAAGDTARSSPAADAPPYAWPLQNRTCITSSFGESRPRHFHSGMDLSTGGEEGREVLAVADGEVVRVVCGVRGYGRALYLQLADGRTAVYGHLARFSEPVERLVRDAQVRDRKFVQDLYPPPGLFPVERGQVVALSGQSGAGPPHLHVEIREGGSRPMNPFLAGLKAADDVPPVPSHLAAEPLDRESLVEGRAGIAAVPVRWSAAHHAYVMARPLRVEGRVGLSVAAIDQTRGCAARLAPYSVELFVDDRLAFLARLEETDFAFGPQAEVAYRPGPRGLEKRRFFRLHTVPGLRLALCGLVEGDGVIEAKAAAATRRIRVRLADFAGNEAVVLGTLAIERPPVLQEPRKSAASDTISLALSLEKTWRRNFVEIIAKANKRLGAAPRFRFLADVPAAGSPTAAGDSLETRSAPTGEDSSWGVGHPMRPTSGREFLALLDPVTVGGGGLIVVEARDRSGQTARAERRVEAAWLATREQGRDILFDNGKCRVSVPPHGLFFDAALRIRQVDLPPVPPGLEPASRAFRIDGVEAAFDSLPWIGLRATGVGDESESESGAGAGGELGAPAGSRARPALYRWDGVSSAWVYLGEEEWGDVGWIGGRTGLPSILALLVDRARPRIHSLAVLAGTGWRARGPRQPLIRARMSDVGSGFEPEGIEMMLDERWVPAEWDPELSRVTYQPEKPLARGSHHVKLRITDRAGNAADLSRAFQVP